MGYTIRVGPDGDALVSRESSPDKNKKSDNKTSLTKAETRSLTPTTPTKQPEEEQQRANEASTPVQGIVHTRQNADVGGIGGGGGIATTETRADIEAKVQAEADEQEIREGFITCDSLDGGYESPESQDEEDGGVRLEREETDDEDAESQREEH